MLADFKATQAEQSSAGPRKILDFSRVEKKWQAAWEAAKIFHAKEDSKKKPKLSKAQLGHAEQVPRRKFYNLEMFPYPSGSFLHMGHVRNYTIGDIIARFKRMQGFNVLYPMGFDSFGLPAENAAKKAGIHPKQYTEDAIKKITEYLKALGNSYDWSRTIATHEPEYYKWNQWFFLKFLERGLVYRKKAPVNWCPECNSTLANEEVVAGCCWRHESTQVEQKDLEQWFLKTTAYADELLKDLDKLNWSDRIKNLQRNWIGRSEGTSAKFKLKDSNECLEVFTTRIDTIFSVTFLVMAPENQKVLELVKGTKYEKPALEFIKRVSQRDKEDLSKEGFFIGKYAINPATKDEIPIYLANFVVAEYGTGAVMADAHDKRDVEFAEKYKIPLKEVLIPRFGTPNSKAEFRKTISAIVRRKSDGKFLLLKWKKFPWISPVVGGIDNNEDPLKTAEREALEETGYKVKAIRKLGGIVESHFFAENKNVWRKRHDQPVLLELIDEKPKPVSAEEKELHEVIWLSYEDALKQMTHPYNAIGIQRLVEGRYIFEGMGVLTDSGEFSGLTSEQAIPKIQTWLEKNKFGGRVTNYKLRDWLVSRQRYWGTPIPIVYCDKCSAVPVPEKELPVLLPERVDFAAQGNPIASAKSWLEAKCPKCKSPAKRETDTMGGFVDSSWYFLRYCSPKEDKSPFEKKAVDYWMPVNQYIGGIEHAVGHLIYSRFWTKVLRDMKMLNFDEPFAALFNQGIVYKGGHKMSKSFGNVVYQTGISEKYGIDTARIFLMSVSAPESDMEWSDSGVEGSFRLLQKISKISKSSFRKPDARDEHKRNLLIKRYTEHLENFKFNLAVIELAQYADYLAENPTRDGYETLLILLAPFAPHTAEELWHSIGKKSFVSVEGWPDANEKAISKEIEQQEQTLGKIVQDIRQIIKIVNETPKKIYLYAIPKELDTYKQMTEALKKEFSVEVEVWANNNQSKYDPEHKADKAKPGKPGIYLE